VKYCGAFNSPVTVAAGLLSLTMLRVVKATLDSDFAAVVHNCRPKRVRMPSRVDHRTGNNATYFVSGASAAMRALERVITDIAPTDIPVLLVGENGTGKGAVALELHNRSRHCDEPFVKCNCSIANFDSLVANPRPGGRAAAASGTLFLDEIVQLGPSDQRRMLQLLPDGDRELAGPWLSARVISATTKNLEDEMQGGRFLQELYYRIDGVCLRLPSLRHRTEDIPDLLAFFLKKYAVLFNRQEPKLGPGVMDLLLQHSWPGNVRELENMARKIVALGDEQLALGDLAGPVRVVPPESTAKPVTANGEGNGNGRSLKDAAREASRKAERELILKALDRTHWNRKRTARELQISYKALLYKLKQLNLDGTSSS
jgi:two-component system response regulator AtoC